MSLWQKLNLFPLQNIHCRSKYGKTEQFIPFSVHDTKCNALCSVQYVYCTYTVHTCFRLVSRRDTVIDEQAGSGVQLKSSL